ncbi:MAG: hypothetical protein CMI60_22525 [Parvibaculum sp.]|nr:hypothetical protein [Parvibaculum sp.]
MGSYTGTGTTTGNVTTTGFRPAFLMVKATTTTSEWVILDNTRDPNPDPAKNVLHPNNTNADSTAAAGLYVKFTDTGFQPVGVGTDTNSSGQTYIYMAFADTRDAVFNFDASGNKNNFEPFNINSNGESETTYDLMKDTPSLVDENAANFAVFNPLAKTSSASTSNANLTGTTNTSTTEMILSTVGVSSGKWYWEVTPTSITSGGCMIGIRSTAAGVLANNFVSSTDGFGYYTTGNKYSPGASASYGASYTTNDVIGVALDMDAGTLTFYKNNVSQGTAFTSISGTYTPGISNGGATSGCTVQINFGQRPFAYTPPTGFLKLNTFNLPDLTIEDGSDYFAPVIYTGNGSNQDITTEHASDFVWIKSRSSTTSHGLYDNVRGTNKPLNSNNTNAEADYGAYGVDAFLSTGFGVTDIASSGYGVNENTVSYVAWSWKANGSGSSNTDGSVTSTVSANTTAGFSIVGFTAPSGTGNFTAGHGLGVTPAMVIVKTRDSGSAPWYTWSNTFSNLTDDYIRLNATSAKQTQSSGWGAGMTSSVIGLRAGYTTVATEDHIAYCFVEVEGYSSFGKYTGNGSTDGPFVYTGFRPAFIITKNSSGTGGWHMTDTTRFAFNSSSQMGYLDADTTAADVTARIYNTFANGFQIRDNGSVVNTNGSTYIYMAFAENPFKNANAR